ncbi:hypothetical protein ACQPYE_04540 [Actinosynnema sp. CA-299493]
MHEHPSWFDGLDFDRTGALSPRPTAPSRTFASTAEFLDGLRKVRTETSTSFRQIEQRSNGHLPRATAQAMVATLKTTLPTRADQVELFVKACGGSAFEVNLWVSQWRRLRDRGARDEPVPESVPLPPTAQVELMARAVDTGRPHGPARLAKRWWAAASRWQRGVSQSATIRRAAFLVCWTVAVVAATIYVTGR